jgi:hypothetical protein
MLTFFKKSDLKICSGCQERFTREQDRDKCEKKHLLLKNIAIEKHKQNCKVAYLKRKIEL